jgi:hypothetical protein
MPSRFGPRHCGQSAARIVTDAISAKRTMTVLRIMSLEFHEQGRFAISNQLSAISFQHSAFSTQHFALLHFCILAFLHCHPAFSHSCIFGLMAVDSLRIALKAAS